MCLMRQEVRCILVCVCVRARASVCVCACVLEWMSVYAPANNSEYYHGKNAKPQLRKS
jgi:hypothetical protein